MGHHPQSGVGSSSSGDAEQPAAAASAAAAVAPALTERNSGAFRFWHDERRFKGAVDKCLVQQALFAAGGVRTGGYPKTAPCAGPLGFQRPADWDLLWSPARSALRAVPGLKAGQLVSAVPGMYSLTKKRRLSATLKAAYGGDAWDLMPQSFSLPQELPAWQAWVREQEAAGTDPGPWMLKTAQHLGKGLVLLPGAAACQAAQQPRLPSAKPFVLAQRYVSDPLLINGCKFGIRLWLLVTGVAPFTAYLHNQGLVLFSTASYDLDALSDEEGAAGKGHITNYAANVNGTVWTLPMLKAHLGGESYRKLWGRLVSNAARVACAAMGDVRAEHAKQHVLPNSTFELLGLDYLVDADMHPWLLEVNGTPSLAVAHHDAAVEALIHGTKASMVQDMVSILDVRQRFNVRYGLSRSGAKMSATQAERSQRVLRSKGSEALAKRRVDAELQQRGGWLPLMGHFPVVRFAAQAAAQAGPAAEAAGASSNGSAAAGRQQQQGMDGEELQDEQPSSSASGDGGDGAGEADIQHGDSASSATSGIAFSDSDKRLFVYMQQWWQKHRAQSKKRLPVPGRKRLRQADTLPGSPQGQRTPEDAAVPMDV